MKLPPNIILIGFMGSGKSTTGKELSKILNCRYLDLDQMVESETGKEVKEIFKEGGEKYFRGKEKEIVAGLRSAEGNVISTGGGTWIDEENRNKLLSFGWCVWLKVSPEKVLLRVSSHLNQRPLLASEQNPRLKIETLLSERNKIYSTAHATVDTNERTPKEVALEIIKLIEEEKPFDLRSMQK